MRKRWCGIIGIGCMAGVLLWGVWSGQLRPGSILAASGISGIVDGTPLYDSALVSPGDTGGGGYADAVDYNNRICSGRNSTWMFRNGYVYWSTKAKTAVSAATTLFRSIGWDITFSADLNGNGSISSDEQITISVARTIRGEYLPQMNYYYINYQQCRTDGVLYDYSLYAMSYDRLQELAKNHEAASGSGQTPVTDAIFSSDRITISIDAIMTTVLRDSNGRETVQGCITSENGTGNTGVLASANGTVETSGTIFHCSSKSEYDRLAGIFGEVSIASYKNSGEVKNHRLTISYYTDADAYGTVGSGGWSVKRTTGQICYLGSPYTESYYLWEDVQPAALGQVINGTGYTMTGAWSCGSSDVTVVEGERYHTSYLAQYAAYPSGASNIYDSDGTLKLYAKWEENGYTIEYYTKIKQNAKNWTKVATQNCQYGQTYRYYTASQTKAPVLDGVKLLGWAEGTGTDAVVRTCGSSFLESDYPAAASVSGTVIKLYALWGVTPYTITCKETSPSKAVHTFYELYGIGFTTDKSLAGTVESLDPYYWSKSSLLVQAAQLLLPVPENKGYVWSGYWDKNLTKQYILANGKALFSSAKTFVKNTTIYGNWKKNYSLTVRYRIGTGVSVAANAQGYGVDTDGFLTVNGRQYQLELSASESAEILGVPDMICKEGSVALNQWYIEGTSASVAGGKSYSAKTLAKKTGGDIASENVSVILAVQWKTYSYYVDYYFRNDTDGTYERLATQTCRYGESCRFYTENQMEALHVPNGMAFAGWGTGSSDTVPTYQGGEEFTNLCADAGERIRLYGIWQGRTLTIRLNGNCPSDSGYPVVMGTTQIGYVYGTGFYRYGDSGEPAKSCTVQIPSCTGYTFLGFFSEQQGGTQMIDAAGNSTDRLSYNCEGLTLYAQWERKTYRITFAANGGQFANSGWGDAQAVVLGGIAYGSFLPATVAPELEGFSFDGYTAEKDGTGELWYNRNLNSGNRRYHLDRDVTLYATWKDDIVPTGTIRASSGNSSSAWSNRNVRLTITGNDSGSGIVKIQLFRKCYFDTAYQLVGEWTTAPTRSFSCATTVEQNGISSYYCVVWDAAGNTNRRIFGTDTDAAAATVTTIYIDKTSPKATEPELSSEKTGETKIHVRVYASDDAVE